MPPGRLTLARGEGDRDVLTLRRVVELKASIVAECRNCRRVREIDALEMIALLGSPQATLGMIRAKARCNVCRHGNPAILIREPGLRGDKAWWPHPPIGR